MRAQDKEVMEQVRQLTGERLGLRTWSDVGETVTKFVHNGQLIVLEIDTYDVRELVREDRVNKHGTRVIWWVQYVPGGKWVRDIDDIRWDEEFTPYVFEKIGRRDTVEELIARREWEQMCFRPGNGRTPLDSYERCLDPMIKSTDKMERHW